MDTNSIWYAKGFTVVINLNLFVPCVVVKHAINVENHEQTKSSYQNVINVIQDSIKMTCFMKNNAKSISAQNVCQIFSWMRT